MFPVHFVHSVFRKSKRKNHTYLNKYRQFENPFIVPYD